MVLKTKLSLGLGFLFLIIFGLVGLCSFFVQKLTQDGQNVLKNNYDSLVYAKNMSSSLEDMLAAVSSGIFNITKEKSPQTDYFTGLFEAAHSEFEKNLKAAISGTVVFGEKIPRLCSTSNVALPGLSGENIVIALDLDGIAVSSGSSCSSGKITPSHVLSAMGVDTALAGASLRVSFGWNSTAEDADAVVASLVRLNQRTHQRAAE